MLGAATALMALASAPAVRAQAVDTSAVVSDHGNWTLKEREHWLSDRLDKARDDGSIDHHEYMRVRDELSGIRDDEDRLRDHHDGQLTDNETTDLEARLDTVASQIHWLHEESFQRPW
jgi:demethoxyubiquinone hydroxylase (CLK1/Coq7/Cat5 family)